MIYRSISCVTHYNHVKQLFDLSWSHEMSLMIYLTIKIFILFLWTHYQWISFVLSWYTAVISVLSSLWLVYFIVLYRLVYTVCRVITVYYFSSRVCVSIAVSECFQTLPPSGCCLLREQQHTVGVFAMAHYHTTLRTVVCSVYDICCTRSAHTVLCEWGRHRHAVFMSEMLTGQGTSHTVVYSAVCSRAVSSPSVYYYLLSVQQRKTQR